MQRRIIELVDKVWSYLVPGDKEETAVVVGELRRVEVLEAVDEARLEWEQARRYFDLVTDPDLIDHAIYVIEATERKYMYLLRRARELGYEFDAPSSSDLVRPQNIYTGVEEVGAEA